MSRLRSFEHTGGSNPNAEVDAFLKQLLELSPQATDPPVAALEGVWLPSKEDSTAGFAALLIPESSLPPHRVILKNPQVQHHYYVRTGSGFHVATHTQLEDMFGRRPRPHLVAVVRENFAYDPIRPPGWLVAFDVENQGRGTAKQVYIEFQLVPGMDSYSQPNPAWSRQAGTRDAKTGRASLVLEFAPTRVIYPGMAIRFDALRLGQSKFVSGEFVQLTCTLYCDGCAPVHTTIQGTLTPAE